MNGFFRWFMLVGLVTMANARSIAAMEPTKAERAEGERMAPYDAVPPPPLAATSLAVLAVEANRGFAVDLYQQLAKENQGKNLFFSPYSMSVALAMTVEGARGETALQMGDVLHFPKQVRRTEKDADWIPWDNAVIDAGLAAFNKRYNAEKDCELRVANALWGEKTYPFAKSYLEAIEKSYGTGHVTPVDFLTNAEAARKLINTWVKKETKDRIKDLIPPQAVDRDTVLVLTNAIYFKGAWFEAFPGDATKEEDFFLEGGKKVRVPLMHHDALGSASYAAFNGDGTWFDTPTTLGGSTPPRTKTRARRRSRQPIPISTASPCSNSRTRAGICH